MSFFDENELNDGRENTDPTDSTENTDTAENAENTQAAETEEIAEETEAAETAEETTSTVTEQGGSVAYEPSRNYTPYTGSYYGGTSFRNTYEEEKQREERTRRLRNAFLASLLAVAVLVTAVFSGVLIGKFTVGDLPQVTTGTGSGTTNPQQKPSINRGDLSINVAERDAPIADGTVPSVVRNVKDAVVEIRTETTVNSPYYGNYVESGAGSGVIISSDGLILTCNHVIDGGETIHVVLTDGSTYVAEVYGTDSWSDLALIRIDATGLPYAELAVAKAGSADPYSYMAVGEQVVAIGNPLGSLGGSVTSGIISALGRQITVEGVPMTLMQIDASVNPGNSGGGLFNMDGNLIGIVNAKSTGDSIEGIGFAIPSSDAISIVKQLYEQGYVSGRPYLGIYMSSDLQIQSYEYNDELTGEEKIQTGDVLYSVDGVVLGKSATLKTVLARKKVGDKVKVQVVRYVRNGYGYRQELIEFELTVHEYVPTDITKEDAVG